MRNLGRMGESTFSLWCDSVGLIANGSKIDETGWDYLVEFPLDQKKNLPTDMLPAPLECKIQVKATDQKKRKTQITVSNLHRLVKAPVPAFICFIEFSGKNKAQASYLVHIGKTIMEKTLKKIRELDVKSNAKKLSKRTITIMYTDDEKLKNTDGESLKESIERYIPQGVEEYMKCKNGLLKTMGFETGSGQINITVSGNDPITDMVDLTLGLRKELNIDKFVARYKRFGILSPKPFVEAEKGILSIPEAKPFTKAILTFREYTFSPGISFSADFYSSQLNSVVPNKYLKFRVKGKLFEMTFEPFNRTAHYTFHLTNEDGSNLRELRDMLKVLTLFRKPPNMLELEIKADGLPPLNAKVNCNEEIDDWSRLYNVAEMAVSICNEFNMQPDNITVNVGSLIKQTPSIGNLFNILKGSPKSARVEFTVEGEGFDSNRKISCIVFLQTHIGDHVIGCHLGMTGYSQLLGAKRYTLNVEEFVFGPRLLSKQNHDFGQEILDEEFKCFSESLKEKGVFPIRII